MKTNKKRSRNKKAKAGLIAAVTLPSLLLLAPAAKAGIFDELGNVVGDFAGDIIGQSFLDPISNYVSDHVQGFLGPLMADAGLDVFGLEDADEFVGGLGSIDIGEATFAASESGLEEIFGSNNDTALSDQLQHITNVSTRASAQQALSAEAQEQALAGINTSVDIATGSTEAVELSSDFTVSQDLIKVGNGINAGNAVLLTQQNALLTQANKDQNLANAQLTQIDEKLAQMVNEKRNGNKGFARGIAAGNSLGNLIVSPDDRES